MKGPIAVLIAVCIALSPVWCPARKKRLLVTQHPDTIKQVKDLLKRTFGPTTITSIFQGEKDKDRDTIGFYAALKKTKNKSQRSEGNEIMGLVPILKEEYGRNGLESVKLDTEHPIALGKLRPLQ